MVPSGRRSMNGAVGQALDERVAAAVNHALLLNDGRAGALDDGGRRSRSITIGRSCSMTVVGAGWG